MIDVKTIMEQLTGQTLTNSLIEFLEQHYHEKGFQMSRKGRTIPMLKWRAISDQAGIGHCQPSF